jgi:hypothetical protein
VACPACLVGHLAPDAITAVASTRTIRGYDRTHLPTELSGTFHGLLRCAKHSCREAEAVVGDYSVDFDARDDGRTAELDFYRVRFALPALKIIQDWALPGADRSARGARRLPSGSGRGRQP